MRRPLSTPQVGLTRESKSHGITGKQVDAFDTAYKGDGEPGDDPTAPYHRENLAAEAAEQSLAGQVGVDWLKYLGR